MRAPGASISVTLARCTTCGEWHRPDALVCRGCGLRFVARALEGLAVVPDDPRIRNRHDE